MEIIRLNSVFKQMIWGGNRMRAEFGYDIPGEDTGECWAISAHRNGDCTICGGTYDGQRLSWLWQEHQEMFGFAGESRRKDGELPVFPLLTKIIDARQNLSIQVHPDDAYAMEHENGSLGKTECWYILDCDPGATIIIGHNARTHAELEDMIRNGRWSEFIREIPIKKGDFFQIYPGTVHAIKGGTLILETQQNSDITYRVYDYDRLQNGQPRALHVQQSIDVITVPFTGSAALDCGQPLTAPEAGSKDCGQLLDTSDSGMTDGTCRPASNEAFRGCTPLIHCDYYSVWKLDIAGRSQFVQDRHFLLCSVIEGSGMICDADGVRAELKKGDHFILPAGFGTFTLEGELSLICSSDK